MFSGLNRVIIFGRLGHSPELTLQNGRTFAKLNLATRRSWKNSEGNWENRTDWHRVMVFGDRAESCVKWLRKGLPVLVEGHLRQLDADPANGRPSTTVINADRLETLSSERRGHEIFESRDDAKAVDDIDDQELNEDVEDDTFEDMISSNH